MFFLNFGINPIKLVSGFRGLSYFLRDYSAFRKKAGRSSEFGKIQLHPIFGNRFQDGGVVSGHYFHQDLYMARKIYKAQPLHHLDIGSRTDGFIAHLAVFREVEIMDIRPISNSLPMIKYIQADLSSPSFSLIDYTSSISCLHAIEHFGLGRYGDPIDPDGYLKGLHNIYKCLKKDGMFYFSTPMGPSRIEFNAHRVFSLKYLLSLFQGKYDIISFSYIDDKGDLHENPLMETQHIDNNFDCTYGCALFELRKTG